MKRWKKTDGQPNVVLKAAPDVLLDRNDHKHSFTRNQMNNDDIWETPNHKKILEPGFRTPPKIPVIGLPVNIPASTPSMSKKEFLKAQRLRILLGKTVFVPTRLQKSCARVALL